MKALLITLLALLGFANAQGFKLKGNGAGDLYHFMPVGDGGYISYFEEHDGFVGEEILTITEITKLQQKPAEVSCVLYLNLGVQGGAHIIQIQKYAGTVGPESTLASGVAQLFQGPPDETEQSVYYKTFCGAHFDEFAPVSTQTVFIPTNSPTMGIRVYPNQTVYLSLRLRPGNLISPFITTQQP
ncbi:hypothetical protein [Deinococcus misasensis]|uniref:hypothetical protein n=1 Tax=Deinococcus misasensis TaxID=392413 RepID=UPI0005529DA6|nr:hypothetical protein [Deinococcus misasensis]